MKSWRHLIQGRLAQKSVEVGDMGQKQCGRRPVGFQDCIIGGVFVLGAVGGAAPSVAQNYPVGPIQVVVPFAPGGGTDTVARRLSVKLSQSLGQSVVVVNRPGAATQIGSAYVAKSPPDGYRLLMSALPHVTNPALIKSLPYDTLNDFVPISILARIPSVLLVSTRLQVRTIDDLVRLSKSTPAGLNYGSPGQGTAPHLAMELFKQQTGLNATHIAYKGAGPQMSALVAGQIDIAFASLSSSQAHVISSQVKALGIASSKRARALPNVPTLAEVGFPNFEASAWFGMLAPAQTPRGVIELLNREIVTALKANDVQEAFDAEGIEPVSSSPEEFAKYIRQEIAKWSKVVELAGLQPE